MPDIKLHGYLRSVMTRSVTSQQLGPVPVLWVTEHVKPNWSSPLSVTPSLPFQRTLQTVDSPLLGLATEDRVTTCFATHFCCNANRSSSMIKHMQTKWSLSLYLVKFSVSLHFIDDPHHYGGKKAMSSAISKLPALYCILGHQKCTITLHGTMRMAREL